MPYDWSSNGDDLPMVFKVATEQIPQPRATVETLEITRKFKATN